MKLVNAVKNGDIKHVRKLLDSGADSNIRNSYGYTALQMATQVGHTEIVRLLLDNGADPNIRDKDLVNEDIALITASRRGDTEIVRLLLENGADPNIRENDGETALIMASMRGRFQIVRLLLVNGANPNIRDNDGYTALSLALSREYTSIVKLLEHHIGSSRIQSRYRGRQTLRKARTQRAHQQLQASRLSTEYEPSRIIAKHLSKMPYNPDVSRRIQMERDENDENDRTSHYLNTLYEGGSKKKRKKKRKKEKKMRGGMTDNEEIINQLKLINTKLDLCCPKNYDQATRNIQRVYRGHKDRNTFKQKRRSMKPNVTDSLLDMPTDFGSMIMDKIPEVMEERREKHIERGREQRRASQREGDREIADIRRAVREGTVNWEDVGISAAEWAKIEEIAEEYSWDEDSDIYNLLVEFRYDNANPQSLLVQGYERRNGMWRMPNE